MTTTTTSLSAAEVETLRLLAEGCTRADVARRRSEAEDTVKSRLRVIYRKLDARSQANAVAIALRAGIIR